MAPKHLFLLLSTLPLISSLIAPRPAPRQPTRLHVISPEAMVTLQKMTNRKSFEETVETYAKQKRLSTREAELEYATYLLDPDAFVLDAAIKVSRRHFSATTLPRRASRRGRDDSPRE